MCLILVPYKFQSEFIDEKAKIKVYSYSRYTFAQVFSVRSGGATGIVIKSPGKPQKTLVLEDKGPILSIKFSTDQKLLSIQRSKSSLDIHNMDSSGQVDPGHYSLSPKVCFEQLYMCMTMQCVPNDYHWQGWEQKPELKKPT